MIHNVSQIEREFLIKTLVDTEQPVRLRGITAAGTGLITTINRSLLSLKILEIDENTDFSVCEHVTGYFACRGHTYAFESIVRNSNKNQICIDQPDKLLRSLQRKYVRVRKPKNVHMHFYLANEEIQLDYPICPDYMSVDDYIPEQKQFGENLQIIMNTFRNDISKKCSNNTIMMFRTKKPGLFEETLICNTGKVLFIPSTESELPKKDPYPEGRIITSDIEEKFEDPNYFIEGTRFSKLLAEKKEKGISSEIWCPIIYYQYVVGYIYVVHFGAESFDVSMVDYLWDFSRMLAYQLKETGYFKCETGEKKRVMHVPAILDMCPEGMLISLPVEEMHAPLKESSVFTTEISCEAKTVNCLTKVLRRYEQKGTVTYGTTFFNQSAEDIMNLYEFLYRKPYTHNDPLAYEQAGQF